MKKQNLTCIGCPLGCGLTVEMDGSIVSVKGNTCKRGDTYARKEVTNPTRIVTTTIEVVGGSRPLVSVKTKEDIPKTKMMECMEILKKLTLQAPVSIGDVVAVNVANTGVDVVATQNA